MSAPNPNATAALEMLVGRRGALLPAAQMMGKHGMSDAETLTVLNAILQDQRRATAAYETGAAFGLTQEQTAAILHAYTTGDVQAAQPHLRAV